MRTAFLALRGCCDYEHVGGVESLVRRLAHGISQNGHQCDYILYRSDSSSQTTISERIKLHYCQTFDDALSKLEESYDHVLMVHILPRHRLQYARFQFARRKKVHFHKLMLGTPKSQFRWAVFLAEFALNTQNGLVLTTSYKTSKVLSYLKIRNHLLLPPVPESYYVSSDCVKRNDVLTLTYTGRIASEKGSNQVFDLFNRLRNFDGIHTQVYGYHWSDDRTTLRMEHHRDGQVSESTIDASESIYRPEMEEHIQAILRDTDVLVLPYCSTKGTINPPLLLLEGMASGCAVLTRPVGNVPAIYGESPFVIRGDNFVEHALELIERIQKNPELLEAERKRIKRRITELGFSTEDVTDKLIRTLKS